MRGPSHQRSCGPSERFEGVKVKHERCIIREGTHRIASSSVRAMNKWRSLGYGWASSVLASVAHVFLTVSPGGRILWMADYRKYGSRTKPLRRSPRLALMLYW